MLLSGKFEEEDKICLENFSRYSKVEVLGSPITYLAFSFSISASGFLLTICWNVVANTFLAAMTNSKRRKTSEGMGLACFAMSLETGTIAETVNWPVVFNCIAGFSVWTLSDDLP